MKTQTVSAEVRSTPVRTSSQIRAIVGASSGNLIEWFDFFIYSFCSLYFAGFFFPSSNPTTQLMNTAGVFATGFLMRPIGGWLFGRIADRRGRRTSMVMSVWLMCGGSLAIALLPGYAEIGTAAPILLLLARCLQGLSVGGEYGASATYMSEIAQEGRRGFLASFQYVTIIGGQIAALVVVIILQQCLTSSELHSWGWRIPFALGGLGAIVAWYLRRSLEETSKPSERRQDGAGTLRGLFTHKRALLIVVGFTAGGSLAFYTLTTYMQKYLINTVGLDAKTASLVMTVALIVYMFMQPAFGALSDRIGRRQSMLLFGILSAIGTVPFLEGLRWVTNPYGALGLILMALAVLSFYTSISGLVKAELFPAGVRALGVGLPYAMANAAFGGTAEYVALSLKASGSESLFFWYVTAMCAIAAIASLAMPETGKAGSSQL